MNKYTNVDMKHLAAKPAPVYVPWEFFAGTFLVVALCFLCVSMLLLSPDDFRFYDLARFCGIASLPFALLSAFCVWMIDRRNS